MTNSITFLVSGSVTLEITFHLSGIFCVTLIIFLVVPFPTNANIAFLGTNVLAASRSIINCIASNGDLKVSNLKIFFVPIAIGLVQNLIPSFHCCIIFATSILMPTSFFCLFCPLIFFPIGSNLDSAYFHLSLKEKTFLALSITILVFLIVALAMSDALCDILISG